MFYQLSILQKVRPIKRIVFFGIIAFHVQFIFGQEGFTIWENTTKYSRTFVVNQNSKYACDTNSGTIARPFLTVNAALKKVKAGERVLIYSGVYRENIVLKNGGMGGNKMISIESVPNHKVIIKGSKIFEGEWVQDLGKGKTDMIVTKSRSSKLWITTLDDSFFEQGYHPFKIQNVSTKLLKENPGLDKVNDIYPFQLKTGIIFQKGKRMVQVHHYGDLVHVIGSFWVDADNKTLHIHPFDNKNPNYENFEITTSKCLLEPVADSVGYVQVKGLIFEHCANSFIECASGALNNKGGKYWIFDGNEIRNINACGLFIDQELVKEMDSVGNVENGANSHVIIRNNKIYSCGTSGILINNAKNVVVKNNEIANCGWQEVELLLKTAAIKLFDSQNVQVSNNFLHNYSGAAGISLITNKNVQVTRNIIYQIGTQQGAIYAAYNEAKNLFDNNFIWEVVGIGINGNNSSNQQFLHNLVAYTSRQVIQVETKRASGKEKLATGTRQNRIINNLLIDFAEKMEVALGNELSNNAFVFNAKIKALELKKWQQLLINNRGFIVRANAAFNANTMMFKWNAKKQIRAVSFLPEVKTDYAHEKRSETSTIPGPFRDLPSNFDYYVLLTAQ